ncbi:unnamed protein product [Caenorhabditis brenneri]
MPAARTALLAAFQKLAAGLRLPIGADKLNRNIVRRYKLFKINEIIKLVENEISTFQNSDNVIADTNASPLLQTYLKDRNLNDFQGIRDSLQKAVEACEGSDKVIRPFFFPLK